MNPEKYAELFASEAREHLEQISRSLVALEAKPDDSDSVDAIFRSVHTIKGMAAAMGYDDAAQLSHSIESVLDGIRSGSRTLDSKLLDLLLTSSDALEAAVDAAVAGEAAADWTALIKELRAAIEPTAEAESETAPAAVETQAGAARKRPSGGMGDKGGARRVGGAGSRSGSSRVRVDIRRLDRLMNLIGELMIVRNRVESLANDLHSEELQEAVERASGLIAEMQTNVIESRMVPVWQVFDRFPRVVRDVARLLGKEVEIAISGKELELDRSMLDAISDPLVHMLRNAVDHGIEPPEEREKAGKPRLGRIEMSARRDRSRIEIVIKDDGRGVDRERVIARARQRGLLGEDADPSDNDLFRIITRPGFSTAEKVTSISGRGVGLDVVEHFVRGFGGSVDFSTEQGVGSTLSLELPLTVAIVRALIVDVAGYNYALPVTFIRSSFEISPDAVEVAHGREWVWWRDERLSLTRLQRLFGGEYDGARSNGVNGGVLNLVAVEFGSERLALSVDRFVGEEEIVVKAFDPPQGALPIFSGATIRADGSPALIVDVTGLS